MNRLFVNALKSVGLVTSGDDPEATVTFWKAKDVEKTLPGSIEDRLARIVDAYHTTFPTRPNDMPRRVSSVFENFILVEAAGETIRLPYIESEAGQVVFGNPEDVAVETAIVGKMLGEIDAEGNMTPSAGSATVEEGDGMPIDLSAIEDADLRKSIEDALAEKDSQITALQAEITPEPDPVEKASDEVKAILKSQEEELAKVRDDLAKERATRRQAEFAKRAERLAFIGKADDMAPVLEEIEASVSPETYEKLETALQTANSRVEAAANQGLFKELGTEEGSEAAYEDRRDAWVEKNRKDDESVAQARKRFLASEEGKQAKQELRS